MPNEPASPPSVVTRLIRRTWSHWLVVAFAAYAVALVALGFAAHHRAYVLTIVLALVVAIGGVAVHGLLDANHSPLSRWQVLVLFAVVAAGVVLCVIVHVRVFSGVGFLGLSLIGFGVSRLAAELRRSKLFRPLFAWVPVVALAVGIVVVVIFGAGGWLVLGITVLLVPVSMSISTEAVLDLVEPLPGDAGAKPLDARRRSLAPVAFVLLAVGVVLAVGSVGWPTALLIGVVVFVAIGAVASNTDADIAFVLVAVAIVWAQFPRSVPDAPAQGANGTIVVFGDSYISGEGARRFYDGTNTRTRLGDAYDQCRRAPSAFAPLVATRLAMTLVFEACSGATTANIVVAGQYVGEQPKGAPKGHLLSQLERFDAHGGATPTWVLVSIGGNDVGFGDIVKACLSPGDCSQLGTRWQGALDALGPKLRVVYNELHRRWGDAVVAVPYPEPLRETGCDTLRSTLTDAEHAYLHDFVTKLDGVIRAIAADAGVRYLEPVEHAFDPDPSKRATGSRICDAATAQVSVNYFALNPVGGDLDPTAWVHNSMHPNERGHLRLADIVETWLAGQQAPTLPANAAASAPAAAASLPTGSADVAKTVHHDDSSWMYDRTRDALRGTAGAAAALIVLSAWLLWVQLLRLARVARAAGDDWTREHVMLAVFRSPSWLARGVGCFLTVVTTLAVSAGLSRVATLPSGYGSAQSDNADTLAARPPAILTQLRTGAVHDLRYYIPMYVVLVIAVLVVVSPLRPRREELRVWRLWQRTARRKIGANGGLRGQLKAWWGVTSLTWLSIGLLLGGAVADAVETTLFHDTVNRLVNGEAATALAAQTRTTATWTSVKLSLIAASILLFVANVLLVRVDDAGRLRMRPFRANASTS